MTPEKKALELVGRFKNCRAENSNYFVLPIIEDAKQLALITVDEIINVLMDLSNGVFTFIYDVEYWGEVKKEIKKL